MAENFYFSVGTKEKSWALLMNFREADSGIKPLAKGRKCRNYLIFEPHIRNISKNAFDHHF